MTTRINLALQGGGAHGAFTWGVLDRLLDEDSVEIAALSGTSAGALNAAALKAGMIKGGRKGAKDSLARLWRDVARVSDLRIPDWMQTMAPGFQAMGQIAMSMSPFSPQGMASQVYTPYAWGPMWRNPLEKIVRRLDFSDVCASEGPELFIGATRVDTGRIRIFSGDQITPEALMASACLPTVFQAVEIDGHAYWDGGYAGNPALFPLYQAHLPNDVLIVSINPLLRPGVPKTPIDIQNRVNEISFNAALLGELRAVHFVRRLLREGRLERGTMKDVRIHLMSDDALMTEMTGATKMSPSPALFARLRAAGHLAADAFLHTHGKKLGSEASFDLSALFG
ncbi:MAG: patatin-like phospholipase family protein [Pseudotabrizicola sp.]|uniref:patatin-like phospholipase family protein n=1 Tax=Pseudotabrizicola sp. TaxID=2939647 RepID=UPI002723D601|nr:patatin-like phospholipase family protein [Pseudotabrizicola sp.]MDO8882146.1 patatin-like phospholipase family protein [Pseudotabrizicola sp.]MDP2082661.1 patatin-like phospholipase family protein [Pseudotabrizicola sp.]MDZ7573557.1 patatin-like phospholipase family protein [Pseudotabrizicola sp.]